LQIFSVPLQIIFSLDICELVTAAVPLQIIFSLDICELVTAAVPLQIVFALDIAYWFNKIIKTMHIGLTK
jgi:hypothetical protein